MDIGKDIPYPLRHILSTMTWRRICVLIIMTLAYALCNRIRTALGIFKSYRVQFPSFQEQANIALRHHCREGNLKWVSLTLWADADPYCKGPDYWDEDPDPENDQNALELAAGYEHFEVSNLKKIRLDPTKPELNGILLSEAQSHYNRAFAPEKCSLRLKNEHFWRVS